MKDFFRESIDPKAVEALARDSRTAAETVIRFARLAPSSHNTQPWLFHSSGDVIDLWGDDRYVLPASDADRRQFFISLGCALENMVVAADYFGLDPIVEYFPNGLSSLHVARIRLHIPPQRSIGPDDHLVFSISSRHASRALFIEKQVSSEVRQSIMKAVAPDVRIDFSIDSQTIKQIAEVVGEATEVAFADAGFCAELASWIRWGRGARDGMPDYNIGIPWLITPIARLAIRSRKAGKQQRAMVDAMMNATPAVGVLSSADDGPSGWVAVGRSLERCWLVATRLGVRFGLLAAPVQIGDFHASLEKLMQTPFRAQAFFRIGYAENIPPPSPRRAIGDLIKN